MRDDFRNNEGIEKNNDINTERDAYGIVEDLYGFETRQEQTEKELEENSKVVQTEGAYYGAEESSACEKEEADQKEEEGAPEESFPRNRIDGAERIYTAYASESNRGAKRKRCVIAIISAIVAVILVCAITVGALLTALLFGLGLVGVGGIGAAGLFLFNRVETQDIVLDTTPNSNIDVGIGEEMRVTKNHGGSTESNVEMPITEVVELVADTVVEITTTSSSYGIVFGQAIGGGAGSGVIISENGYIITNHHVIYGAGTITVRLTDGREYEAGVVGSDAEKDVALIKINASGLRAATLGSSRDVSVGQQVVAIGNPLGTLGGTVTDGIISALDRTIIIDGHSMTLLQTNAAINPGNSGGGLFNHSGELIGIVNAKQAETGVEGLGFAIPIDIAWETVLEIADKNIPIALED